MKWKAQREKLGLVVAQTLRSKKGHVEKFGCTLPEK